MSFHPGDEHFVDLWDCDSCGKRRAYLPDSWHQVGIISLEHPKCQYLHFCLECMTDKKVWEPRGVLQ